MGAECECDSEAPLQPVSFNSYRPFCALSTKCGNGCGGGGTEFSWSFPVANALAKDVGEKDSDEVGRRPRHWSRRGGNALKEGGGRKIV